VVALRSRNKSEKHPYVKVAGGILVVTGKTGYGSWKMEYGIWKVEEIE